MKLKLENYIKKTENNIKNNKVNKDELIIVIKFFQHERLVHLLVTFFVGIAAILFLISFLLLENIYLFILFLITLCLFIPYIFHYYYLENGTQKLYDLYLKSNSKEKIEKL